MLDLFTVGCDPEMFVRRKITHELVPAPLLGVPGTKENPHKVEGGAIQVDGLALEFNIDPCKTFEEFNSRIELVMAQLKTYIPEDCEFLVVPTVEFPADMYEALPDEAKVLGCDPDFNAWNNGRENKSPDGSTGLRSAAGHIHIGWTDDPVDPKHPEHIDICCNIVRHLDHYVGLALSLVDTDYRRAKLYGRPGAFRPKSYGVEYRVPSNWWIAEETRRRFIWDALEVALKKATEGSLNKEQVTKTLLNNPLKYSVSGKSSTTYEYVPNAIKVLIPWDKPQPQPLPYLPTAATFITSTHTV